MANCKLCGNEYPDYQVSGGFCTPECERKSFTIEQKKIKEELVEAIHTLTRACSGGSKWAVRQTSDRIEKLLYHASNYSIKDLNLFEYISKNHYPPLCDDEEDKRKF